MPKKLTNKQQYLIMGGLVIVLVALVLFIHIHNNQKSANNSAIPLMPNSNTSGSSTSNSNNSSNTPSSTGKSSQTGSSSQSSSGGSGGANGVSAPQGQASHTVVSKSATIQAENSPNVEVNCLTQANNNCVLRLTSPSGNVTNINNSYSDGKGPFIFDFSAKNYETGSWKMEIVASYNGQEASTNIGPLEVKP